MCSTPVPAVLPPVQSLDIALIAVWTTTAVMDARSNGLSFIYDFLYAFENSVRTALDGSFCSLRFIATSPIGTSSFECRGYQSNNYLLISDHVPSTVLGTGDTK